MSLNKEQLRFFVDEILGELGWDDEAEQSGIDVLDFCRLKINELRQKGVWWKESYYLVADAVARESSGPVNLADIARQTRIERDLLREQLQNIPLKACEHKNMLPSEPHGHLYCPDCGIRL